MKSKFKISNKSPVISDADERIIEGWASTKDLDRYNEIVEPAAFKKSLKTYMKNPVLFFGHEWWSLPIGKVLSAKIKDDGLWVKAKISESADEVWSLLKEEMLKTFSIGYKLLKYEKDQETDITTLLDLELLEISVVGIPANPEAMIELAKSKGINIKSLISASDDDSGASKKETIMENEAIEKLGKQVDDLSLDLKSMKKDFLTVDDAKKSQEEIKEAMRGAATTAELKELQDKSKVEFEAAVKTITKDIHKELDQKWVTPPQMVHSEQAKRLGLMDKLKDKKGMPQPEGFKSLLIGESVDSTIAYTGMTDRKELLKELQETSDNLVFLGAAMGMTEVDTRGGVYWKHHPESLKMYQKYRRLIAEFAKALDTETTAEGTEWLPTYMSATLLKTLDIDRGVIKRIPRVSMPSKTWDWPMLTSRPVAYKKSEATSDSNVNTIILSTAGTGKITFAAKGLAVGSVTSTEEIEDSIIPILPRLKEDFRFAMIDAEENIIINGDDSTTHQDTDHAAGSAALAVKLLKGLRYLALNCSTTSYVDLSGTLTYANIIDVMGLAGKYALKPGLGFHIVSYAAYFDLLALSEFTGQAAIGIRSVTEKGQLNDMLGHDIVPSEHMRQDLGPAGVNAGADNVHTGIMYIYPKGFMIGDRRLYTIESDKLIMSDQIVMVATERIDLQKMVPTADTPATFGYNITT